MLRYYQVGPAFGLGIDLAIGGNAGYAKFGRTYQAPPGYTYGETNTSSLLAGSEGFTASEIEVLYLWNCAHTYIKVTNFDKQITRYREPTLHKRTGEKK